MSLFSYQLSKYGKTIAIESREVKPINGLPVAVFTEAATPKAIVCTLTGVKVFDSTNTETEATHKFCMAFTADITNELFIKYKAKRYRILSVENCCESDAKLIIHATQRGVDTKDVNSA